MYGWEDRQRIHHLIRLPEARPVAGDSYLIQQTYGLKLLGPSLHLFQSESTYMLIRRATVARPASLSASC